MMAHLAPVGAPGSARTSCRAWLKYMALPACRLCRRVPTRCRRALQRCAACWILHARIHTWRWRWPLKGRTSPDGGLMQPPPGVGRLLARLDGLGYPYLPVGVAENERSLMLTFGPSFRLNLPPGISKMDRDKQASVQVMTAIASQLPEALRGQYA